MDTKQLNDALEKLFRDKRIVFWSDPERKFVNSLPFILLDGVKVNYGKFGSLLAEVKAVTGKKATD